MLAPFDSQGVCAPTSDMARLMLFLEIWSSLTPGVRLARMRLSFLIPLAWLASATIGVLVAHFFFGVGWGWSVGGAALVLVSIFLNGLLATWEDEQPGGFNNPTPKQTGKDSHSNDAP